MSDETTPFVEKDSTKLYAIMSPKFWNVDIKFIRIN